MKRSASMPSILLSTMPLARRSNAPKNSKRSFTLGLGEQRDLQGKITMSFRDFDRRYTASSSRSGVLVSAKEMRHDSSDSLDVGDLPPPSPPLHSDDDERSVVSVGDETLASRRHSALYDEAQFACDQHTTTLASPTITTTNKEARVYPASGGGRGKATIVGATKPQSKKRDSGGGGGGGGGGGSSSRGKPSPATTTLVRRSNERSCTIS